MLLTQPTLWGDETELDNAITGQMPLWTQQNNNTSYDRHPVLSSSVSNVESSSNESGFETKQPWWKSGQYQ